MLDSLFIHNVTVIRWGKGQDLFGNMANSVASYIPANSSATGWNGQLKCRIERYQSTTQYRESGERLKNATIIYMPISNPILFQQDEIYENGIYIGLVLGINPALKATVVPLDHYEYILDNP